MLLYSLKIINKTNVEFDSNPFAKLDLLELIYFIINQIIFIVLNNKYSLDLVKDIFQALP